MDDITAGQFNDPRYRALPHNYIQLREALVYEWGVNGVTNRLIVPVGYIFDGASIPIVGIVISAVLPWFDTIYPYGDHLFATAFHDFIWQYKGRLPAGAHTADINRQWVDAAYDKDGKPVWHFGTSNRLFARHLRELGVGKKERRTMYLAVSTPIGYVNWLTGDVPEDARPKRLPILP